MKFSLFILAGFCLGLVASDDDSIAMESNAEYGKIKRHFSEGDPSVVQIDPIQTHYQVKADKRRTLAIREREARGDEESALKLGRRAVFELPPGYEIEGKYVEPGKGHYSAEEPTLNSYEPPKKGKVEGLSQESSQNPRLAGSYLNHIKENMHDGKVLGYSSFVEHFSDNDDAEDLKSAMKEGSLDDIKRLVPKSSVSFQMYHGEEKERAVKEVEHVADRKPEIWNEINEWHQPSPTPWTAPQTHYIQSAPHKVFLDQRKRIKKIKSERHRPHYYHLEEPRNTLGFETTKKKVENEVYTKGEDSFRNIVPSISFELPSETFKDEKEYEVVGIDSNQDEDREVPQATFSVDGENGAWQPVSEKSTTLQAGSDLHAVINTPKPPETSKIYYQHFKTSKPTLYEETSKYSQLPKVGKIIVEQTEKPKFSQSVDHPLKKPHRTKTSSTTFKRPALASGEDFTNHHFAQIPTGTPPTRIISPQTTRYWSKPDTGYTKYRPEAPKRLSTPIKLEKILNKQTESHGPVEKPKENGNVFLTKEFQNDVSEFFKGGKNDFEWVPSTHLRYDLVPHDSTPTTYQIKSEETTEAKPKRYRIYRSHQPPQKSVVFLGPDKETQPGAFPVSASYTIDKNRKSDEKLR